jgi:hypothetical protein
MTDPFERAVLLEKIERSAEEARAAREGFRVHAVVYVAVNIMLVVIWALTWTGHPWFVYPLLGWGIGLAAHYTAVRNLTGRERRLQAELHAAGG